MKIEGFKTMLTVIQNERGIPKEMLVSAVEAALLSASRKKISGTGENLSIKIDDEGNVEVFAAMNVVEEVSDPETEISLEDAKKLNKEAEAGGQVVKDVTPKDFGRLAAQTAKQVIMQRIREAEKELSFDEFTKKQGEIVTGTIQQKEYNGYLVNLGRVETLLPFSEVEPSEPLRPKDRVKVYVAEVSRSSKGPQIIISRTNPGLVKKLFELEIPEIAEGTLEIKNVVREAGRRTKIAIESKESNVSVVGTCVGHMGARIQNIVREMGNERIDIIEWKADPKAYIANALSPAKPVKIELEQEVQTARVTVPDSQLSLAIGKEGQNVRLASKLTGWKIDIKSDTEKPQAADGDAEKGGEEQNAGKKETSSEKDKG
jgi:transcription termination/antitermination protein NusA